MNEFSRKMFRFLLFYHKKKQANKSLPSQLAIDIRMANAMQITKQQTKKEEKEFVLPRSSTSKINISRNALCVLSLCSVLKGKLTKQQRKTTQTLMKKK